MGHQTNQHLSFFFSEVHNLKPLNRSVCDAYYRAKQTRSPFPSSKNNALSCFDLVHCDLWGPYREPSSCGAHYFLTLVDDFSRGVWMFLIQDKIEARKLLMSFFNLLRLNLASR